MDTSIRTDKDAVSPYITDSIWIGLPNHLKLRLKLNGHRDAEIMRRADELQAIFTDDYIQELYARMSENPQVKWKDSIKKMLNLDRPTEAGLDV